MSKREAILEAVITLSDRCKAPGEMTVSAVAECAAVGKGTVYEYFPSKERMIAEAVGHFIRTRLGRLTGLSFSNGFGAGFAEIVRMIRMIFEENRSFLRLVFLSDVPEESSVVFSPEARELRGIFFRELAGMLLRLAEKGKSEGIVEGDPKPEDLVFAFFCVASALCCEPLYARDAGGSDEETLRFLYDKFVRLIR